jgi:hypothetical protein
MPTHSKDVLRRRHRDATSGRLGICAPLTSRFPPLTRKRAMTAEGYGSTVPTGRYPVVDHDFGTCPPLLPGSPSALSADCRKCRLGLKYAGVFKASAVRIPFGKYPRFTAGFRGPGGRCAGSVPADLPHRRPAATPDASPEPARRPGDCEPSLVTATGAAAKPGPQLGKASLRILFLPRQTELSADTSVLDPKGRRPILGGGVQSHMGYHGGGGRRVAMRHRRAFHAIARNNSATVEKSGRPHG